MISCLPVFNVKSVKIFPNIRDVVMCSFYNNTKICNPLVDIAATLYDKTDYFKTFMIYEIMIQFPTVK